MTDALKPSVRFGVDWATVTPEVAAKVPLVVADSGGVSHIVKDREGNTPLHFAAVYNKNPGVIAALVNAGADVDELNEEGKSPFMLAMLNDNLEVMLDDAECENAPCFRKGRLSSRGQMAARIASEAEGEFMGDSYYLVRIHEIGDINKDGILIPGDLPLRERAGMPLFGRLRDEVLQYRRELLAKEKTSGELLLYSPMIDLYGGIGAELVERALDLSPGRARDALRGYGIGERGWRNARDWRRTLSSLATNDLSVKDLQKVNPELGMAISPEARHRLQKILARFVVNKNGVGFHIMDKVHPSVPRCILGPFDDQGTRAIAMLAFNAAMHELEGCEIFDLNGAVALYGMVNKRVGFAEAMKQWKADINITRQAKQRADRFIHNREVRVGPGRAGATAYQQIYDSEIFAHALRGYAAKRIPKHQLLARVWVSLKWLGEQLLSFGINRPWQVNSIFKFELADDVARVINERQKDKEAHVDAFVAHENAVAEWQLRDSNGLKRNKNGGQDYPK